ncbi:hypothetical protein DCC81_13510 [Chitinophaga parva]|uniref:RNA polymerase sigma-70 factor n=1 Tax=Chitinophaga parva TaxID=2169414 RepID=A0A2T7BGB1_9BACT|nr:RNA polymerase sigma-70 factor [Chitinophaga parva]PUZ25317.1 hypothetical protein DCC81_13510 [Chitinophaga parva]
MPFIEQSYFRAIQEGDEKAFEALFTKHYESLVQFSASFIPDMKEDARDIVVDVFAYLWLNRSRFTIKRSLSAYLYSAVRNKTIDNLRKQNLAPVILCGGFDDLPLAGTEIADRNLYYKETDRQIATLIELLPTQARLIFRMNRDEGLSYEEIASVLEISVNTVKTQMYRALRFLKKQYTASHP